MWKPDTCRIITLVNDHNVREIAIFIQQAFGIFTRTFTHVTSAMYRGILQNCYVNLKFCAAVSRLQGVTHQCSAAVIQ